MISNIWYIVYLTPSKDVEVLKMRDNQTCNTVAYMTLIRKQRLTVSCIVDRHLDDWWTNFTRRKGSKTWCAVRRSRCIRELSGASLQGVGSIARFRHCIFTDTVESVNQTVDSEKVRISPQQGWKQENNIHIHVKSHSLVLIRVLSLFSFQQRIDFLDLMPFNN